jgi:hypothetical protein
MGSVLTKVVKELSRTMAAADASGTLHQLLSPNATSHKAIFFSLAGRTMITYSMATAKVLHQAPLALALTAPLVLGMLAPAQVRGWGNEGAPGSRHSSMCTISACTAS